MDWKKVKEVMRERGFSMAARSMKGKEIVKMFFTNIPTNLDTTNRDYIPNYTCIVNNDGNFSFVYQVPGSMNELRTPECSPFENDDHFYRICVKFEQQIKVLFHSL